MRYAHGIWQDVATPCVLLPEYGSQVPAIPAWTVGGDDLERAFLWGALQAAWAQHKFYLDANGQLRPIGRKVEDHR